MGFVCVNKHKRAAKKCRRFLCNFTKKSGKKYPVWHAIPDICLSDQSFQLFFGAQTHNGGSAHAAAKDLYGGDTGNAKLNGQFR